VENAIKYGSRTTPGVLRLNIRVFSAEEKATSGKDDEAPELIIEIANTGKWLPPDPSRPGSTGIGLENLRQRLQRYYPGAHAFTLDAHDGWVTVRLRLARLHLPGKPPLVQAHP
jgi:LytS/YehU family sensor histidine kinase